MSMREEFEKFLREHGVPLDEIRYDAEYDIYDVARTNHKYITFKAGCAYQKEKDMQILDGGDGMGGLKITKRSNRNEYARGV